jgi:transposase
MANAHSLDLRRRVVRAVEVGASCRQAAARFEVGVSQRSVGSRSSANQRLCDFPRTVLSPPSYCL